MAVSYVCSGVGMVLLCVFLKLRVSRGASAFVTVIKSTVSIGFMFTALNALYYGENKTAVAVCAGLMFGMLGDIFLDQKYAHPDSAKVYTYAGFLVFAAGHIFYDIFLIKNFYTPGKLLFIIIPFAVSIVVAVLNIAGEDLMKLKFGEYKMIMLFTVLFCFRLSRSRFQCRFLTASKIYAVLCCLSRAFSSLSPILFSAALISVKVNQGLSISSQTTLPIISPSI